MVKCVKCSVDKLTLGKALEHFEETGHRKFSSYGPVNNRSYYIKIAIRMSPE